jgi:DegV family protein with EDD domain
MVVPMWVTLGSTAYRDGELPIREVLSRLGEGLSTSGPGPGDFAQAVEAADTGSGVAILTVSGQMSSSYEAARLAAKLLEGEREVAVVDTGTAAGAEALAVLAASKAARAGSALQDVVAASERAAREARLLATLPSLEHLARGGRVPGSAAWGARWLGLHPLFEFRGGEVRPLRPARSEEQAYRRMVDAFAGDLARYETQPAVHVAALHAMDETAAAGLLAQVTARAKVETAFVGSFSPVMVAHTGPGLVGLAWWLEGGRRGL